MKNSQTSQRNSQSVYALDFDGVICDSAIETSVTAWKAAQKIWQDIPHTLPSEKLMNDFRQVRPFLETGYEAILMMRLLQQGVSVASLSNNYTKLLEQLIHSNKLKTSDLKNLFGETRDHWIKEDLHEWLKMNPLFAGIQQTLIKLEKNAWYIITTKQERFVKYILQANNIHLKDTHIYGMERKMSKADSLLKIVKKHPNKNITFIEDRLPTLVNIHANKKLKAIKLYLASWGYNTSEDKGNARNLSIELIDMQQFHSIFCHLV